MSCVTPTCTMCLVWHQCVPRFYVTSTCISCHMLYRRVPHLLCNDNVYHMSYVTLTCTTCHMWRQQISHVLICYTVNNPVLHLPRQVPPARICATLGEITRWSDDTLIERVNDRVKGSGWHRRSVRASRLQRYSNSRSSLILWDNYRCTSQGYNWN